MLDFNFDRLFARDSARIVTQRQQKQSVEARQRDIYDSHRHRTFALAYYMTGSEVEAEEILTGTFINAFRANKEPDGRDVDTALIEELQQRSHLCSEPTAAAPSPAELFDEVLTRNVKRTELEEALQELSPADRLLFLLRDVEGYSTDAIAQLLEMSEAQVQRNLFMARIRLRRILAEAQASEEKAA